MCRFIAFVVAASTVIGSGSVRGADDPLYEILKDAQVSNRAAFPRGKMAVHVAARVARDKTPIEFEGTVLWNGKDTFWIYRLSDPGGTLFRDNHGSPLASQPTEYLMIVSDRLYAYNPFTGMLLIRPFDGRRIWVGAFLYEVQPETNWFKCCPPYHDQGSYWAEKIGPKARGMRPDSRLSIEQIDDDRVRQRREDPDGGVSETTFSLALCGNVVEHAYRAGRPAIRSRRARYRWKKAAGGLCVLESCEGEADLPGEEGRVNETYRLTVQSIDLKADVSPAKLSFAALKAYLPPDTLVDDEPADRQYRLKAGADGSDAQLRRFAGEIRSRGFLKAR